MSAVLAAVQEIEGVADPSIDLSPYSRLSVAAMGFGYETLLDTPLPDIAVDVVTSAIDGMVTTAVQQAIGSLSSIPVVGAIAGWLGFVVDDIASAEERREARGDALVRAEMQRLSRLRPIGTGFGGKVMPADLLAAYLDAAGRETTPPIPRTVTIRPVYTPTIGAAIWQRGGPSTPVPERPPGLSQVAWTNILSGTTFLVREAARATGYPGPTSGQRIVFHAVGSAIAASRLQRDSDGGAGLWPVLLDTMRSGAATGAPRAYWEWMSTHGATYDGKVDGRGVALRSAWRVYPTDGRATAPWRDAVDEIVRGWGLAVSPVYQQDRARAEEIRRQVEAEVRRILTPRVGIVGPVRDAVRARARSVRLRRAAVVGAAGLGAAAAFRPDLALAAVRAARAAIGRVT